MASSRLLTVLIFRVRLQLTVSHNFKDKQITEHIKGFGIQYHMKNYVPLVGSLLNWCTELASIHSYV